MSKTQDLPVLLNLRVRAFGTADSTVMGDSAPHDILVANAVATMNRSIIGELPIISPNLIHPPPNSAAGSLDRPQYFIPILFFRSRFIVGSKPATSLQDPLSTNSSRYSCYISLFPQLFPYYQLYLFPPSLDNHLFFFLPNYFIPRSMSPLEAYHAYKSIAERHKNRNPRKGRKLKRPALVQTCRQYCEWASK